MTKLVYILTGAMLMALVSCGNDEPVIPAVDKTRTVLVYMVAHNNLSSYSTKDLAEMAVAAQSGYLGDSRLLVYKTGYNALPSLVEIKPDGTETLIEYDDDIMSVDSRRLSAVVDDMKRIAPADRYGLIFWGHGTGYVQDGIDDIEDRSMIKPLSYGGESVSGTSYWMNTTTMARTLSGKGFDWIYFDCCFMAGVEVAYEMRHVADYIVASATELPANGMPYDRTLKYLMPYDSDLAGAAGATFDCYDGLTGMNRTCTMSVIRTDAMDGLAEAVRSVYANCDGVHDGYVPQAFQTDSDHRRYGWSYYDLGHYVSAFAGDSGYLRPVQKALDKAVVYEVSTPLLWNELPLTNHCGLSTLIIESDTDPQLDRFGYRELSWWSDVVAHRFNR